MSDHERNEGRSRPDSGIFAKSEADSPQASRERAPGATVQSLPHAPDDLAILSPEDARKLLHELRVHQIELETQNEELRRAQQELELSRQRYFDLYDLAPVGYLTISDKGLVLEANLTAAGLLDVPRNALVQKPWTKFILAEDQDIYLSHRRQLLLSGGPLVCELRLRKSNGGWFWARLEGRAARDIERGVASRTVLSDITERKQAHDALEASESRHRALFYNSRDALMTLAPPSWHFTSANAATLAMFGAREEAEFLSNPPWHYSPERQPDGRLSEEKARSMIDRAMQSFAHVFEWTHHRVSGEEFRATVTLTRIEANGGPLLQATVRDESEAERKRGILAQTERLASMGMLAASVGHEINNPLSYVLTNTEDLARDLPTIGNAVERCRQALLNSVGEQALSAILGADAALLTPSALKQASDDAKAALDGARRISRISRVLGAFARADAGDLASVQLERAIEFAVTICFNELRFRAKLNKVFQPVPNVWASEGKLSQVFLNLLINASHAMPEGNLEDHRITVRTWAEGQSVFAAVEDTGTGIASENLPRIFEPFFTTKPSGAGSGLGLSICRSILTEFGGDIRVHSEPGKGTRFVIRLPAETAVAHAKPVESTLPPTADTAATGRILVVDDEEQLRVTLRRVLTGHEVVTACSAVEAQSLLATDHNFDVILCDLIMPGMTGIDLHRWLAQHDPSLANRVVFITGGVFGNIATEYLAACGNLVLDKPFDVATLRRTVSDKIRSLRLSVDLAK